ncbi:uncharacterized protein LOC131684005 [Topomyia yanbarensis]|uniref:uncharacterized protein LOC131684005 n=1 Tax=Topomyia yanbarensis TaxID=2498891 RepID=UPI00273B0340|nr:uncharacterized protein LOC131684005 [Topomyia yanbarensis]XP_058822446.1 uncharacterized protein LOC131684005 [Topomyia yanbarensis]
MPQYKSQLAALIKGRGQAGFSEYEVLKIFCDVCESLAQLHCCQAPVIYRDLKVENVVQNDMGRFILAESETATTRFLNPMAHGKKIVEEEVQKYTSSSYRAPEMVDLNSGHSITTKVDIWALGCMLYRLCFGVMPFGESSKAILHCQYTIPENSKYSPELCQLIRFLLEPDPEKRPSIYQVCEFAFKTAGKDNPLRVTLDRQKSQPTTVSSNISDQSDRRLQYQTITATMSGTSVAPRSRPKAQQTNTGSGFQLGPLNASPKNVVSPTLGIEAVTAGNGLEKNNFVANFSGNFPTSKLGSKSPAAGMVREQMQPMGSGEQQRNSNDLSYRFYQTDSKHLFVPSMDATGSKEKSTAASPASLLLSPFEPEQPSSSSSSTRPRPTTLMPSTVVHPSKSSLLQQQHVLSNSNSEKSLVSPVSGSTWNPFGDPSSFSPNSTLTEDQLFGAEFDKLRLEGGSQTSIVTSPEEMKSERGATTVPAVWLLQPQHQRFSLPILSQAASTGALASSTMPNHEVVPEEDPFGSAPFTLPKRLKDKAGRSSKLTSKLSEVISSAAAGSGNLWRHSTGGGKESLISTSVEHTGVPCENGSGPNGELEGVDKSALLGIKLDDLISGGEKGSPNFIKLPLDDRNKYEKLNSNDVTSDDSDSEFYPDSVGGVKKQSFKQFVESNIPEKLQAVYHKVDKGQIKNVQIVKKLRGKVVTKDDAKKSHQRTGRSKGKLDKGSIDERKEKGGESDDSIGSASDLRANDDFVEGEEIDGVKATTGKPVKRFNRLTCGEGSVDDCISESIKTCGSSAYHAECESVTTNEDDTSRIVTRVRVKKREHDSKHSVIDEDDSGEEDMVQGDKPLLLDDELDYESAPENNSSSEEVLMDPFTPESLPDESEKQTEEDEIDLDPFAMAPFRKPAVPKRNSIKYVPNVHPIPEACPAIPVPSLPTAASDFFTSTPVKPTHNRSQPEVELFGKSPISNIQPVTVVPEITPQCEKSPKPRTDIFGLEPFPPLIISQPVSVPKPIPESVSIPTVTVEPGSVALTHIIPNTMAAVPVVKQEPLPTVVHHQHQSSQLNARLSYINFSQVSAQGGGSILPDNNYVNFDPDDDDVRKLKSDDYDDSSDAVVKSSSKAGGFLSKKEKVKYNSLKDKTSVNKDDSISISTGATTTGNHVLVIPAKLSQKVKVNVGGYKKVSLKSSKKDKSNGSGLEKYEAPIGKPQSSKVSKKMGFSNMSFEDFPSDELVEEQLSPCARQTGTGSKLMKIAPFEVVRNEKMLLEAEKKFGSLKRRSNPFS